MQTNEKAAIATALHRIGFRQIHDRCVATVFKFDAEETFAVIRRDGEFGRPFDFGISHGRESSLAERGDTLDPCRSSVSFPISVTKTGNRQGRQGDG